MLATDLDEGDLGEARLRVRAYRLHEGLHVVAARDGLGDVLGPGVLGGLVEAAGPGSSELTFQPPSAQRNWSWARATAASRSVS